jgi:hypothetical protein
MDRWEVGAARKSRAPLWITLFKMLRKDPGSPEKLSYPYAMMKSYLLKKETLCLL